MTCGYRGFIQTPSGAFPVECARSAPSASLRAFISAGANEEQTILRHDGALVALDKSAMIYSYPGERSRILRPTEHLYSASCPESFPQAAWSSAATGWRPGLFTVSSGWESNFS